MKNAYLINWKFLGNKNIFIEKFNINIILNKKI